MATDMVTVPMTRKGQIIFALGSGILTTLIRLKGGYPEGVCYSILLMNSVTPLIDPFYTACKIRGKEVMEYVS
jgi:electron transport complex protein RnfD